MKADILKGPAGYALVVLAGGVVVWMLWDKIGKTAKDTANLAGGLLTGNNAITDAARTDAYKGKGVLGTLGAAFDNTFGGGLSILGENVGDWYYDASTGLQTPAKTVQNGADATDSLWGKIGNVLLRRN